jgi:hypothetical protein
MTERPTDYDSLVAAVREMAEAHEITASALADSVSSASAARRDLHTFVAKALRALLPPAKERVPWHEAKGRTVDGKEVTSVHDTYAGTTYFLADRFGGKVDPDGMVEVDAL